MICTCSHHGQTPEGTHKNGQIKYTLVDSHALSRTFMLTAIHSRQIQIDLQAVSRRQKRSHRIAQQTRQIKKCGEESHGYTFIYTDSQSIKSDSCTSAHYLVNMRDVYLYDSACTCTYMAVAFSYNTHTTTSPCQ